MVRAISRPPTGGDKEIATGVSDGSVVEISSVSLTAKPTALSFSSTENSLSLDLEILASAVGSISITSLQRSKALGTGTVGGFTLSYTLNGLS